MLKKHIFLLAAVLLVLSGCARRNPAWQDQDTLTLIKQVQVVGNPVDLSFDDDHIFVAQDQGGISLIDITDYSQRWWPEVYPPSADAVLARIRNISAIGEHKLLFLSEYYAADKIRIIDYSDLDSLKLHDSITGGTDNLMSMSFTAIPNPSDDNIVEGFFAVGGTEPKVLYARYNGELYLGTDYSIVTSPWVPEGTAANSNYVFVAAQQRGLLVYNRVTRLKVGELALPGEALHVKLAGNYAYVASRQGGLNVVNVGAPDEPLLVKTFDTTGYATTVDVQGNLAAVSSGSGGIYLFDVSTPGNPILKQNLSSAGYTNNAKFHQGKLVVASRDQGVLIYAID